MRFSAPEMNAADGTRTVLVLLPSLGGGGAEMHAVRLINQLDPRRWKIAVACIRGKGSYASVLDARVPVHVLCPGWLKSSTLGCLYAVRPLRRLLQAVRPELVCSFLPHTNVLLLRALQDGSLRPRLFLGVQNNPSMDWERDGMVARLTANRAAMLEAYRRADAIVALSHGVARDFAVLFPDLVGKVTTVYNIGCDARVFTGARTELPARPAGHAPLLVACGRLEAQKDYPTLLRAVARAREKLPGIRLRILGQGRARRELEQLVKNLGLGEAVEFLGFQANPYRYMAAADMFVLSSRWEGFGNVLVEAMACAVPVISTDCPFGPAEILDAGRYGVLVPVGDAAALAEAMTALWGDPERRRGLREAGLKRARLFLPEPIAQEYDRVFAATLAG